MRHDYHEAGHHEGGDEEYPGNRGDPEQGDLLAQLPLHVLWPGLGRSVARGKVVQDFAPSSGRATEVSHHASRSLHRLAAARSLVLAAYRRPG
jgi:hypothetical protein